jgi:predicted DNA-binding WGR domain protein
MQPEFTINAPIQSVWSWQSKYRYYTVYLQQNLFEEWTITQSWGGLKNRLGGVKIVTFSDSHTALIYISRLIKIRREREYKNIGS